MRDRWLSLDVFRGATVALMILVNNPGSWNHLYPPLAHAPWHGCTPTDLVFPFFLFAVGNALAFVMPGHDAGPPSRFWRRFGRRTALIFAIGVLLNAAPFVRWDADGHLAWRSWETLRVMGVLQRIALAWGLAALVLRLAGARSTLVVSAALLFGYWAACVGLGEEGDPYSLAGWFGTAFDRALLGEAHLYRGEGVPFDPEGLASTAPAVAQVLLGGWVGQQLRERSRLSETVARLFVAAVALGVAAYAWQLAMPINKKIWTSSYVLLTTALALAALAALVWHIEQRGGRGAWVRFCEVFGKNALLIYAVSIAVPRTLGLVRWVDGLSADGQARFVTPLAWLHRELFADLGHDPRLGSVLFAIGQVMAYWALAVWLDRRRLYFRV